MWRGGQGCVTGLRRASLDGGFTQVKGAVRRWSMNVHCSVGLEGAGRRWSRDSHIGKKNKTFTKHILDKEKGKSGSHASDGQ